MAEKQQGRGRKRKHFEISKSQLSPFQNAKNTKEPTIVSKAPRGINAAEFAESRALEINNMMQALSSASQQSNKRVFQALPRHMRRRAASHNSKRMPVRLRDAYNREAVKNLVKQKEPTKQKKSRRHRRKPSNLLAEYSRRQRKHAWLETHIWHAKRFKMVEQWGYKIPLHPNDKSVRASYRAMANGCLLQDISYYQCIEVRGRQDMILQAMKHLTSSDIGLTMAAKEYLDGQHEGHTMLFTYDQYPNNAIGTVMFLWQQQEANNTSPMTKLWVWSHPVCSDQVTKEIVHSCSLQGPTEYVDSKPWLSKENGEISKDLVTSKSSSSGKTSELTVTVLCEQLVRLRLTGPKSHALLAATLELCEWNTKRDNPGSQWWEVYSQSEDRIKMLEEQNKSWDQMKGVSSPGVLKAGSVMALVVKDPRLGLPVRKSSVDMASEDIYKDVSIEELPLSSIPEGSALSPLWDSKVRQEVKQTKMPEKDLNNLRSKEVVPGSKLDLGDKTSRIPILVIQQPGSNDTINFGSGYDVIFPAGWSMAFWIAFVYRGARVGGARELATCSREQGVPHFPCDFPDTQVGREYNEEQKRNGEEKYKRYPPAKRPNYMKFGIACPFAQDWNKLVHEWEEQVERLEDDMRQMIGSEKDSQAEHMMCSESAHNEGKEVAEAEVQSDKDLGQIQCLAEGIEEGVVYNGGLKDNGSADDPKIGDVNASNKDQNEKDVGSSIPSETMEDIVDDSKKSATADDLKASDVNASNKDQNVKNVDSSILSEIKEDIVDDSERTAINDDLKDSDTQASNKGLNEKNVDSSILCSEIKEDIVDDSKKSATDDDLKASDVNASNKDQNVKNVDSSILSEIKEDIVDDSERTATDDDLKDSDTQACNKGLNEKNVDSDILSEIKEDIADDSERTATSNFHVIRAFSTRRQLQDIILNLQQTTKKRPQKKIPDEEIIEYLTKTLTECRSSLVCLNLRPLSKGCPENNAVIYIPTPQDLMELQKDKCYGGPVENVHTRNNPSSLIGQSSRKAIGWVTSGQYSFARGQGSAIGFCSFAGFCELIINAVQETRNLVVLVRNTNTFQYRFTNITAV